jgi:hypothetical protein
MCKFTEQGLKDYKANHDLAKDRVAALQRELVESEHSAIGEGHDGGSSREDITRSLDNARSILDRYAKALRIAQTVPDPIDTEELQIGHIATFQCFDENEEALREPDRCLVGGYEANDSTQSPAVRSYTAPLIAAILGRSPDHPPVPVYAGGKLIYVVLLKIEIPQ